MALTRPLSTNINFDIFRVTDPISVYNYGISGANTRDVGIVINRGSSTNTAIIWDESEDTFALINTTEDGTTNGNVIISSYAGLRIGTLVAGALTYPSSDGTSGQFIKTDGSGTLSFATVASELVEDTTPQLGGNLDLNSNNITGTGNINITGTITSSGNISAGNVSATTFTGNLTGTATSATSATSATTAGTVTTAAQPNITSLGTLSSLTVTGNISAGNVSTAGELKTTGTLLIGTQQFYAQGSDGFSVNEDFNAGNANVTAYHYTSGSGRSAIVFDTAVTGQFTLGFGATGNAASNKFVSFAEFGNTTWEWRNSVGISAPNLNGGNLLASINSNGNLYTLGTIIGTGNVSGGNLTTAGTVTASRLISNVSTGTAPLTVTSTTQVANLNVATAGTVTTAAQPNITSLGTLTSLTTSGDITVGGNLTVNGTTTTINSTTVTVDDLNMVLASGAANATAANGAGITVDGASATLLYQSAGNNWAFDRNLSVTGTLTATTFSGSGASLTNIPGGNVTGTVSSATTAGTVTTAAQPNITSTGTLSSLTVTGNVSGGNLTTAGTLTASSLTYPTSDGTNGQVLTTNGSGVLTFVDAASGITYTASGTSPLSPTEGDQWYDTGDDTLYTYVDDGTSTFWLDLTSTPSEFSNGNSNVSIAANANVSVSSAGNANIFVVTGTGANVAGTLTVTGNTAIDTDTLFVDATNNTVGIGTSSPTSGWGLSVTGQPSGIYSYNNTSFPFYGITSYDFVAKFESSDAAAFIIIEDSTSSIDNGNRIGVYGDDMKIYTAAAERMCITGTGNVGIGTTSPGYKLEVNGSLNTTSFYIGGTQVTSTAAELNALDGITATVTELNYTDGVTSNIQTQLNAKLASSSYTAADVLSKLLTVDGSGSSLDADLLDGLNSTQFLRSDASATNSVDLRAPIFYDSADTAYYVDPASTSNLAYLNVAGQYTGGFGAMTTGYTDWDHATNARSGSGYTLLLGTATNGPGDSAYYHPFSFEYSSKNGTGNMTQLAIPYTGTGMFFRSRYNGTWSSWYEIWNSGNDGSGSGLVADKIALVATNTTNATHYINFTDAATGDENIRTDTGLTYNPSTGTLTSTVFSGTASQAQYADLAENYLSDKNYEPGTVVVFGGDAEITTTTNSHDTRVAGVISTNPAYLMNTKKDEKGIWLPVSFTGRVPCKVRGPIKKGDIVVSSTEEGVAGKINDAYYSPGCIIGKSLENIDNNVVKTIEVVVGRF